jgi:hypothetical protein
MSSQGREKRFSDAWTDVDLARVAVQARQAFNNKQFKNCFTLTRVLLTADPDNVEAQALQSALRTAIADELNAVRTLLADARLQDDPRVLTKGAELILNRVLNADPENLEAQGLSDLLKRNVSSGATTASPWKAAVLVWPSEGGTEPTPAVAAEAPAAPLESASLAKWTRPVVISACASVLVATSLGVASFLLVTRNKVSLRPPGAATVTRPHQAPAFPPVPVAQPVVASQQYPAATGSSSPSFALIQPKPETFPKDNHPLEKAKDPIAARAMTVTQNGMLAASSRSAAEIYVDGKYMGSTPTTMELPVGVHTVEYRYQNLRQVITHVIRPGETTAATINFEVTVQVNAKPWANVFLEGAERRPLGQTPLSQLRVPVGGTLSFENPNFMRKTHRITGTDAVIQVAFP